MMRARKVDLLRRWVLDNPSLIAEGCASYSGHAVDKLSRVVRYQITISFIVLTYRTHTRYTLVGTWASRADFIVATGTTLLFGWWGVPWGPIYTVTAVIGNLTGAERISLQQAFAAWTGSPIDTRPNPVVTITESAASQMHQEIVDREFPEPVAVRLRVINKVRNEFAIEYDILTEDPRDYNGISWGIPLVIARKEADSLGAVLIDYDEGQFTYRIEDLSLRAGHEDF